MKRIFKSKAEVMVFAVGCIIGIVVIGLGIYYYSNTLVDYARCNNLNTYLQRLYTTEQCDGTNTPVKYFMKDQLEEHDLEYKTGSFEGATNLNDMYPSYVDAEEDGSVVVRIFLFQKDDSLQKLTICEWDALRREWQEEMGENVEYEFDVALTVKMLYQLPEESSYYITDNIKRIGTEQSDVVCE